MTTDTTALQERIEASARDVMRRSALIADVDLPAYIATAVLPIIEREVRAASEKAWDEGCTEGDVSAYHGLAAKPNPYRATEYETGAEHDD